MSTAVKWATIGAFAAWMTAAAATGCYPQPVLGGPTLNEWQTVIDCESSGNPDAVGPSGETIGLAQIHVGWLTGTSGTLWGAVDRELTGGDMTYDEARRWLAEPANNMAAAALIYERTGGWHQWACHPND